MFSYEVIFGILTLGLKFRSGFYNISSLMSLSGFLLSEGMNSYNKRTVSEFNVLLVNKQKSVDEVLEKNQIHHPSLPYTRTQNVVSKDRNVV